jgi:LPS sulfotransferase NodH
VYVGVIARPVGPKIKPFSNAGVWARIRATSCSFTTRYWPDKDKLRRINMPRSYLICATPRCGSTLLCELLTLTGVAGQPNEWLLPIAEALARESFDIDVCFDHPRYLDELKSKAVSANGVFSAKVMWPQMEQLLAGSLPWLARAPLTPPWNAGIFPGVKYVYISRDDEVRQAISFLLARRTGHWQRLTTEPLGQPSAAWMSAALRQGGDTRSFFLTQEAAPRWSTEEICRDLDNPPRRAEIISEINLHRKMIREHKSAWLDFFQRETMYPLNISYEELISDPRATINHVLDFLDLSVGTLTSLLGSRLRPLSDERNSLLARAYDADSMTSS